MKVIRCSDDAYALIADHAGQRNLSLSQAVGELVTERVSSPDHLKDMALPVEAVREVVREEIQRTLEGVKATVNDECFDCKLKDRDLADSGKRIVELNDAIALAKLAHRFASFAEAMDHARTGTCAPCKEFLTEIGEAVARATLENVDDKVLLQLCIDREVIPQEIIIELPEG